ncbi:type VII secretion-associated serine protease mycosin [Micromonospora sp. WMMD1082]|uniref:type VII secretion-associated serine protease mycosin n=1 Tax=Micromonospora sp. WMMD1082 TaxID=3016104 RepID=UPI002417B18C|nr:type VII secretion-associated serine protease mycosin [Micromonospora sp. WMMD1082]MDG4794500.1 type VII secretion-associated serine protease mycosin [Micromonospora sp. WMMD1082]
MRVLTRPAAALVLTTASVLAALALPSTPALADSTRDDSWHIKALELAEMHKITQGEGVVVAVIDTGVDASHQDLKNNVLPGVDLYDDDALGRVDREGHGTGMASLIAAHGHGPGNRNGALGIAPKAKILPVTVKSERSPLIQPTAVAAGINWAVDNGADIVNVSLGSSFNEELNRAVDRAYQRNVIVVAAVGNRDDMIISNPARHQAAVAVNGTDRKGAISKDAALPAEEVDIAAPGEDLVRAAPGGRYVTALGSSGSAAIVSGALALIKAKYPDLNGYEMFQRLLETTRDEGEPGHDLYYGWGALDLREALTGEPDGRGTRPSARPSTSELEPWQANPREREDGILIFVWAVIIAVFVLLVGGTVATVMLLRARRRAARLADDDPPATVEAAPGPDVPPQGGPAAATSPGQPAGATDDAAWRRPPD